MKENQNIKKGWSWMGFLFTGYYYAGYGKFKKGLFLGIVGIIPLVGMAISIYAGLKAREELPIKQELFNFKAVFGLFFVQIIVMSLIGIIISAAFS